MNNDQDPHSAPESLGPTSPDRRKFLGKTAATLAAGAAVLSGANNAIGDTLSPDLTIPTTHWKTNKPGAHDSDLYSEATGYDDDTRLTWWGGRNVSGVTIGVVQFRANLPMLPGNMGNATTFDFPLLYREMVGENIADIAAEQPTKSFTDATVEAAKWLELQGVRAIIGNCGFFATYQKTVQDQIDTPFFSSSLMQLPTMVASLPRNKKVGVITANAPLLKACPAIENCGLSLEDKEERLVIEGVDGEVFESSVIKLSGTLWPAKIEEELVAAARRLVSNNKDIGMILLECTELSPHAFAVQEAVKLPVWDFTTLTNWVYLGALRRPFTGHI